MNTEYLTIIFQKLKLIIGIKKIVQNFSLYNLFKKIIKIHEVIEKYKIQGLKFTYYNILFLLYFNSIKIHSLIINIFRILYICICIY